MHGAWHSSLGPQRFCTSSTPSLHEHRHRFVLQHLGNSDTITAILGRPQQYDSNALTHSVMEALGALLKTHNTQVDTTSLKALIDSRDALLFKSIDNPLSSDENRTLSRVSVQIIEGFHQLAVKCQSSGISIEPILNRP